MYRSNLSLIVSHIQIAARLESILWPWRKKIDLVPFPCPCWAGRATLWEGSGYPTLCKGINVKLLQNWIWSSSYMTALLQRNGFQVPLCELIPFFSYLPNLVYQGHSGEYGNKRLPKSLPVIVQWAKKMFSNYYDGWRHRRDMLSLPFSFIYHDFRYTYNTVPRQKIDSW